MPKHSSNPSDGIKYLSDAIIAEREKIAESLAAIAHYSEQLRRITSDTEQRLLTRE